MNTKNGEKNTDYLDSLLYLAAKKAGENEINNYKAETFAQLPEDTFGKISEKIGDGEKESGTTAVKRKGRLSFVKKLTVAASAALITGALAFGVIARFAKEPVGAIVSSVAGNPVLSYDVSGIKNDTKVSDKVPKILREDYKKGETKQLSDGISTDYEKDGLTVNYTVRVLDSDYSLRLGNKDTDCIGILVSGKYNGYMAVTKRDDITLRSVVAWNDGRYAYELSSMCDADELVEIAQSLY